MKVCCVEADPYQGYRTPLSVEPRFKTIVVVHKVSVPSVIRKIMLVKELAFLHGRT